MPTYPAITLSMLSSVTAFGNRPRVGPAVSLIARWYDRYLQRLDLADLDDRALADIGLTRDQAERESNVPFWRSTGDPKVETTKMRGFDASMTDET